MAGMEAASPQHPPRQGERPAAKPRVAGETGALEDPAPADPLSLTERIAAARWYHSIELPGGIVTPGEYDLPDAIRRIPFPASLLGKRCLDVGTRDGFWAFAMEARGAAEVVGIDLDDPADYDYAEPRPPLEPAVREDIDRRNSAFRIAHDALGSRVRRRDLSVYRLSSDEVGRFDFAFIGTLLLHLRDPVGALAAIRHVLAPGATLITNEPISVPLSVLWRVPAVQPLMWPGLPFWWLPNTAARRRMVAAAGYELRHAGRPYLMRYGCGWEHAPASLSPRKLIRDPTARWGTAHDCIVATPQSPASG